MKYSQQSTSLQNCIAIATLLAGNFYSLINLGVSVWAAFFVKTLFMIMYSLYKILYKILYSLEQELWSTQWQPGSSSCVLGEDSRNHLGGEDGGGDGLITEHDPANNYQIRGWI